MSSKIIEEFIQEIFPKAPNILLFGSCINSKQPNDYDLMILSSEITSFTREMFTYKSLVFEAIIIPKSKIYSIIELDKEYGIYVSIINQGEIIKDIDGELTYLQNLILDKQFKPSPILRKYNIEYELSENIKYLKLSDNKEHQELLLNFIIEKLIDLKLLDWDVISAKKINHKLKEISRVAPKFLSQLLEVKNAYTNDLNWDKLITSLDTLISINQILNISFYSSQYFLNEIYNNELVVHINTKDVSQKKLLKEIINPLIDSLSIKQYFFFEIKRPSISLLEKGFYLIVYGEKEILRDLVLKLNTFVNRNSQKFFDSEFTYPYQLEVSNYFGIFDSDIYSGITSILQKVSVFFRENYIKEEISALWYLNLLFGSYIKSGVEKHIFFKDVRNFGFFLGHSFLKDENAEILVKNKLLQKTILNFNKEAMVTNMIFKTYTSVCRNWVLEELPESKVNILLESIRIDTIENRNLLFFFLSKVLLIDPMHMIYIFNNIGLLLENENED